MAPCIYTEARPKKSMDFLVLSCFVVCGIFNDLDGTAPITANSFQTFAFVYTHMYPANGDDVVYFVNESITASILQDPFISRRREPR